MSERSEREWAELRRRILGLGEDSLHKSHYPALRRRLAELERFRSLVDAAGDLLFIVSVPGGIIVYANEAAREGLGLTPGEDELPSFKDLLDAAAWDRLGEIWASPEAESGVVVVCDLRKSGGGLLPVEIAVRVSGTAGGRHAVLAARDMAERIRARQERDRLEEQLRQVQKLESIGMLAGGVAHDFNNLLTVISGFNELLIADLAGQEHLADYARQIRQATESAAALTAQLLSFSRKQIIRPTAVDLNSVIEGTAAMLRRLLGEDIRFVTNLPKGLSKAWVDVGQMNQVLMNLCANARDAMPDGGTLTIETGEAEVDEDYLAEHAEARPGRYVLLTVSDTGHGMDEETRQRIFEPFFTTKGRRGTGLGLSSVYGIVRQSNGWIWVSSEPGRGTCFKIYLPLAGEPVAEKPSRPPAVAPHREATLLVVEDQQGLRGLEESVLSRAGYRVLAASCGNEAIELAAAATEIHLLITDVVLPGMNGREIAERVKALRPDIKVLYTSGYTADAIVHRGILDKGVEFLPKPFSPRVLVARVRELLRD